jgi:outer membrane lipoprotein LolB
LSRTLLVLLLFLAGCAAVPQHPPRPPVDEITAFAFSGRIAVRQGETRHYAQIDWRHTPARDEVLLATPLGQGLAEIERDASGARLTLADRRRYEAADWSELSDKIFGFRLPLGISVRWLLGQNVGLEGWRTTIVERESSAPDALPSVIELERDDVAVRLKIDEWTEVR